MKNEKCQTQVVINNNKNDDYNAFINMFAQVVEKYGNKLLDNLNSVA